MKMEKILKMIRNKGVKAGCAAVVCALAIGGAAAFYDTAKSPELVFPTFKDPVLETSLQDGDTPLAAAPKVTTKTTRKTSTSRKVVAIKQAATKSYVKQLPATKKTSTKTVKKNSSTTVKTETTVVSNITEQYTKKSKKKLVTTKVTAVVKTTTTVKASTTSAQQAPKTTKYEAKVTALAPKMDSRVLNAFQTLGFKVIVDSNSTYAGYFDARTRQLTLKTADDTVYHELGHFLAFVAGNLDTSAAFKAIYNEEKSRYNGPYKAYTTQNSSEFFAECTREYILHNASLKSSCPKTYAAIQTAFSKVTESQITRVKTVYGVIWKA